MALKAGGRRSLLAWTGGILVLAAILYLTPLTPVLRSAAQAVATPLWRGGAYLGNRLVFLTDFLRRQRRLAEENEFLRARMAELERQVSFLEELKGELAELREADGLAPPAEGEEQKLLARVLTRPWQSPYDTLILDLGRRNSVGELRPHDLVGVGGNFLLGEVEEIYARSSKVRLFSSPGSELWVMLGPERIDALLKGRGGGNMVAILPRGIELNVGERAMIPRAGGGVWVVGEIGEIEREAGDTFQQVFIREPVGQTTLRWVEIYRNETD